jgi:hypothetical protein
LTTPEADEPARTAPSEAPGQQPPPPAVSSPPPESPSAESHPTPLQDGEASAPAGATRIPDARPPDATTPIPVVAPRPIGSVEREVTYVPLAVTVGDGFKFGCGFFLAGVLALLVGFVLLSALFVITGLSGLNLPIGR